VTHVKARIDRCTLERQHAANVCVRSHAKVRAAIGKARTYLQMMEAGEDLSTFVWTLAGGEPILGTADDEVSETPESEAMAKALKKRGFTCVGPVIVHAWMPAVGMLNDHEHDCFLRKEVAQFLTLCRASHLAEARRLSAPWQGASPAQTRASSRPSRAHGHHLRPSTHCEKLSVSALARKTNHIERFNNTLR
jgi:hypothetical protein